MWSHLINRFGQWKFFVGMTNGILRFVILHTIIFIFIHCKFLLMKRYQGDIFYQWSSYFVQLKHIFILLLFSLNVMKRSTITSSRTCWIVISYLVTVHVESVVCANLSCFVEYQNDKNIAAGSAIWCFQHRVYHHVIIYAYERFHLELKYSMSLRECNGWKKHCNNNVTNWRWIEFFSQFQGMHKSILLRLFNPNPIWKKFSNHVLGTWLN